METHIAFTTGPIRKPEGREKLRETGAEVEFWGIVRETEQGRVIAGLDYEAYLPMAEREVRRIAGEIGKKWPCQAMWFVHRLGWVPAGEASLYVRVHASHREAAFRFCMELIDLLKKDVPIWKCAPARESA